MDSLGGEEELINADCEPGGVFKKHVRITHRPEFNQFEIKTFDTKDELEDQGPMIEKGGTLDKVFRRRGHRLLYPEHEVRQEVLGELFETPSQAQAHLDQQLAEERVYLESSKSKTPSQVQRALDEKLLEVQHEIDVARGENIDWEDYAHALK